MAKVSVLIPVYNQEELILRALESIPKKKDIEIIVCDDGSTDNTLKNVIEYVSEHKHIRILTNKENKGVAYTVNRMIEEAQGEYIVLLGSDDYFYTKQFEKAMQELKGTDLVYFDLEINDGTLIKVNKDNRKGYCGSVKFIRRAFLGDTREPEDKKAGEDWYFNNALLEKRPTEKFTGLVIKHYNFPREGSLSYLQRNKLI